MCTHGLAGVNVIVIVLTDTTFSYNYIVKQYTTNLRYHSDFFSITYISTEYTVILVSSMSNPYRSEAWRLRRVYPN